MSNPFLLRTMFTLTSATVALMVTYLDLGSNPGEDVYVADQCQKSECLKDLAESIVPLEYGGFQDLVWMIYDVIKNDVILNHIVVFMDLCFGFFFVKSLLVNWIPKSVPVRFFGFTLTKEKTKNCPEEIREDKVDNDFQFSSQHDNLKTKADEVIKMMEKIASDINNLQQERAEKLERLKEMITSSQEVLHTNVIMATETIQKIEKVENQIIGNINLLRSKKHLNSSVRAIGTITKIPIFTNSPFLLTKSDKFRHLFDDVVDKDNKENKSDKNCITSVTKSNKDMENKENNELAIGDTVTSIKSSQKQRKRKSAF